MTLDELVSYCLAKPGAEETYPWGELVVKVGGKGFAFVGETSGTVGVKAGRTAEEAASEWCARYPEVVTPSAYVGRYGWITVPLGGAVPDDEVRELVDASYAGVVARLPRSRRPAGA
jgi:predicted DNA-binding protein (MmcQ/YjbR family)